ncbi:23S rRNA (guanosine(2251)-2'-O)-methyltransferase RlmB, partial [Rhodococcus sp. NPDC058514]
MAGNSSRRGAIRKSGTKKGQVAGSGGKGRRSLEGRGATPPAVERTKHPAAKRARAAARAADAGGRTGGSAPRGRGRCPRHGDAGPANVQGRHPGGDGLRAGGPPPPQALAGGHT